MFTAITQMLLSSNSPVLKSEQIDSLDFDVVGPLLCICTWPLGPDEMSAVVVAVNIYSKR